jgi:Sigma-70 region 2
MIDSQHIEAGNFLQRAKTRIADLDHMAEELARELDISPEAKYELLASVMMPKSFHFDGVQSIARKEEEIYGDFKDIRPNKTGAISEILEEADDYIVDLARRATSSSAIPLEVLNLEIDEVAQNTRIKFWLSSIKSTFTHLSFMDRDDLTQQIRIKMMRALSEKSVHNLSKYLKSIAHNEYVSFMRRHKPTLSLSILDEEEKQGYYEDVLASTQEGFRDPQVEFETVCDYYGCLETLVREVIAMPRVQMRVAVCYLRDRFDDVSLLTDAFRRHNLDISTLQWPTDPKERQRLQASYAPVRKKLARAMGIDLALFSGKDSVTRRKSNDNHL